MLLRRPSRLLGLFLRLETTLLSLFLLLFGTLLGFGLALALIRVSEGLFGALFVVFGFRFTFLFTSEMHHRYDLNEEGEKDAFYLRL